MIDIWGLVLVLAPFLPAIGLLLWQSARYALWRFRRKNLWMPPPERRR